MDQSLSIEIHPDIIKLIFEVLSSKDLNACAQVCSLWYTIAKSEKKRRDKIISFYEVGTTFPTNSIGSAFIKLMENIKCCPNFCTLFMSEKLFYIIEEYFPSLRVSVPSPQKKGRSLPRNYEMLESLLKQYLPPKCLVTFASCLDIDIPSEYQPDKQLPVIFGGFLLPNLPGMTVNQYFVRSDKLSNLNAYLSGIPDVKCVLIFRSIARSLDLTDIICRACPQSAIGVAVAYDYCHFVDGDMMDLPVDVEASLVVFSGVGVQSASLTISTSEGRVEDEAKLKLIQKTGMMQNRCFAYMFTRWHCWHRIPNNPTCELFKKMYPHVPIIELYTRSHSARNYLPNVNIDEMLAVPLTPEVSEVTVIVVSIKNEVK